MPGAQTLEAMQARLSGLQQENAALRRDLKRWQTSDRNQWRDGLHAMIRNIQARTDLTQECQEWLQRVLDGDDKVLGKDESFYSVDTLVENTTPSGVQLSYFEMQLEETKKRAEEFAAIRIDRDRLREENARLTKILNGARSEEETDYDHIINFWSKHDGGRCHHSIHEWLEWMWSEHQENDRLKAELVTFETAVNDWKQSYKQLEGFKVVLNGICDIVYEFPNHTNENVSVAVQRIKDERDRLKASIAPVKVALLKVDQMFTGEELENRQCLNLVCFALTAIKEVVL